MSRWIDADALITELQKDEATFDKEAEDARNDPSYTECYSDAMWSRANGIRDAIVEVYDAPSIDIVRCKECRYKRINEDGETRYYYCALEDRPNRQWSVDDMDYCSWGEVRDEQMD